MESSLEHIVFFLKNRRNILKENLDHLHFLHSWTYNPQKNYTNVNKINFTFFLPNLYYIKSEAFSELN